MTYDLAAMARRNGVRRKVIRIRPVEMTRTLEQELYAVTVQPVRAWERAWRETLAPMYAGIVGLTVDAEPDDIEAVLARAEAETVAVLLGLSAETREWLERTLRWHTGRWVAAVQARVGIDVFPFIDMAANRDVLEAYRARILNLIRDLDGETRKAVSETIWRGYLNRTPPRAVGREISEAWGVSRRRAAFIASDQANKLSSELTRIRQEEAGFGKYIWRSTGDARVRPAHVALDGRVMEWSKPHPTEGHPGYRPRCVPGGSKVTFDDDVVTLFRRRHTGELTKIISGAGVLECTPNHPILTASGWKPAHSVNVGDYVVRAKGDRLAPVIVDVEKRKPGIAYLFDLLGKALPLSETSFQAHGGDLNGEAIIDQEIGVIHVEGGLLLHLMSALSDGGRKIIFEKALVRLFGVSAFGHSAANILRPFLAAHGIVSFLRELKPLLLVELCHAKLVRGGLASLVDTVAGENGVNAVSAYAELTANGERARALDVGIDDILIADLLGVMGGAIDLPLSGRDEPAPGDERLSQIVLGVSDAPGDGGERLSRFDLSYSKVEDIITYSHSGHVYNLETKTSWFLADGHVVHNCRCSAEAVLELE